MRGTKPKRPLRERLRRDDFSRLGFHPYVPIVRATRGVVAERRSRLLRVAKDAGKAGLAAGAVTSNVPVAVTAAVGGAIRGWFKGSSKVRAETNRLTPILAEQVASQPRFKGLLQQYDYLHFNWRGKVILSNWPWGRYRLKTADILAEAERLKAAK